MSYKSRTISLFTTFLVMITASCNSNKAAYIISVTNTSEVKRNAETVEIWLDGLSASSALKTGELAISDNGDKRIPTQYIDIDQDSIYDYLIFQTDLEPNETKRFQLGYPIQKTDSTEFSKRTFCRIVPERMDDFAWENDKVAFRVYGPECQRLFKEGNRAGLISSGIDCWLKRVDYPIIDKWYANDRNGKSYHVDHGEGLDNYHVGKTRGCGGTTLVHDGKNILSENFVGWKVLANGPIRSLFELEYAPVLVGNVYVTEKKRISLDLGTNLYHCEVSYTSKIDLDVAAVGIALHQGKGKIASNTEEGWVSYWEPMGDSYLGTAILSDPLAIKDFVLNDTIYEDESRNNIWANANIEKNNFSYWAGFGWKKSGDFSSAEDWENYLKIESAKKSSPIAVDIIKN